MDPIGGVANLLGISRAVTEEILWSLLLLGLLAASVQLVTMLVTQWGERDLTWKALLFSLLVHLSCGAGVVAVSHPPILAHYRQGEEPIPLRQIYVVGDETLQLETKGNQLQRIRQSQPVPPRLTRRPPPPAVSAATSLDRTVAWVELPRTEPPSLPPMAPQSAVPEEPRPRPVALAPLRQRADVEPTIPPLAVPAESTAPPLRIDRPAVSPGFASIAAPVQRTRPEPHASMNDARLALEMEPAISPSMAAIDRLPQPEALLSSGADDAIRRRRVPAPPTGVSEDQARTPGSTDDSQSAPGASPESAVVRDPIEGLLTSRRRAGRDDESSRDGGDLASIERTRPAAAAVVPAAPDTEALASALAAVPAGAPLPAPLPLLPETPPLSGRKTRPARPPEYRLRSLPSRRETARRFGGTDATEQAVERALRWLARHQDTNGAWDADGFMKHCPPGDVCGGPSGQVAFDSAGVNRQRAGIDADAGISGLALLAFLGAGYTHEEGEYAEQVERGLRWLIAQQRADGFLGGRASHFAQMYCHAMATYALAEAVGMTRDRPDRLGLKAALRRAIAYTIAQQNPVDGGWRYVKGQRGDMSMFGWQLMALKSAEIAGLPIPASARERMIRFLKERSLGPRRGLAAYRITDPPLPPTPAMTAEAWFCKQMLGIRRDNPACAEAAEFLLQDLPRLSRRNLYYWYYGTLAMYQHGGASWQRWNAALQNALLPDQRTDGHAAGSWDPLPPWGPYGGRVYSTALATLSLEVYYRFLPLYRLDEAKPAAGAAAAVPR